ncbi:hypothetical protein AK812_SmicGene44584, partial [Symbiodinium microadriaticum]
EHADTGTSIWDGAVALSKFLERQPELVRGRQAGGVHQGVHRQCGGNTLN